MQRNATNLSKHSGTTALLKNPELAPARPPLTHPENPLWRERLNTLSERKPELVYAGCVGASVMSSPPEQLLLKPAFSISERVGNGIMTAWNYSDAVDAFISAYLLLSDVDNYRYSQNKVKAALNILSGSQMLVFTNNYGLTNFGNMALAGATALASPAFAFAMLCDFINLSIDFYNAAKESTFEGWFEERLKELRFLEKRIAESRREGNASKASDLTNRKKILLEEMEARSRCYCHEDSDKTAERQTRIDTLILAEAREAGRPSLTDEQKIKFKSEPRDINRLGISDRQLDDRIRERTRDNLNTARKNWSIKLLSLIGMTMLAVATFVACPPLALAGTLIVAIVASYYIYKNIVAPIKNQCMPENLSQSRNHFFNKPRSHQVAMPVSSSAAYRPALA